jgi:hypothetical protein
VMPLRLRSGRLLRKGIVMYAHGSDGVKDNRMDDG